MMKSPNNSNNRSYWKDAGEVQFRSRRYNGTKKMSVEEALAWATTSEASGMSSCRMSAGWSTSRGCYVNLSHWDPYSHPYIVLDGNWELRFQPWKSKIKPPPPPDPIIIWYRVGSSPLPQPTTVTTTTPKNNAMPKELDESWDKNAVMKIAAGFDALFHVVLLMGIKRLAIGDLQHDLAGDIFSQQFKKMAAAESNRDNKGEALDGCGKASSTSTIPHRVEFPGQCGGGQRKLSLCRNLIGNGGPKCIAIESLGGNYSQKEIVHLLQAVKHTTTLEILDLRICTPVDGMYREIPTAHTGQYMISDGESGADISPLVAALSSPGCTIKEVNLGGVKLTSSSATLLASQISACKSLERLGLRATGLNEESLLAVFSQGLPSNDTLKELDVSWSTFTPKVVRALCNALVVNKTLEKLRVEHCEMDLDRVKVLATALPGFKGILDLSLDGNTFTWEPMVNGESQGALHLVEAMKNNHSLWSIQLGEYGQLGPVGRACCTGPTYSEHIGVFPRYELQCCFERNRKLYHEKKWLRMKSAVVCISTLLLGKIKHRESN